MWNHLKRLFIVSGILISSIAAASGQTINPYHMNGNAYQENCNCYTLTDDVNNQFGSVWNVNKIDLNQSFDYKFNINLGCRDNDGADGIVFVLQPISTSLGSSGGGLGYSGITPSIGITIDTWQNTNDNDPAFDHIAIHRNGDINHSSSNNLAGPIQALAGSDNIEDCQWHVFRIMWDATTKTLAAQIDFKDRVQTTIDMVNTVFNGNPLVFWGFTGSTGGSKNRQRFCTSLNPGIASLDGINTCFPNAVPFTDSSASFGSIVKWYWNFGDGKVDSVQTPAPHVFPAPGYYDVKLNIKGNDGCISDTFHRLITIGSKPITNFGYQFPLLCEDIPVTFNDSSQVQYGTINSWTWKVNAGADTTTIVSQFVHPFSEGQQQISLRVHTKEGCVSDPLTKTVNIFPRPVIDIKADDACFKEPLTFISNNLEPAKPIRQWYWNLGNGKNDSTAVVHPIYSNGGDYTVALYAIGTNGCISDTLTKIVKIYSTQAYAGRDTVVADNQPVQLQGTGGVLYKWSPATGLSNPDIPNPIALVQQQTTYTLTAYSPIGCATTDEVTIKVFKGPAFYVPNAFTPNNDGHNDRFRFIPVGMKEVRYFRIYNRYGQLVYSSTDSQKGWDGTLNGKPQSTGAYVWMLAGTDYTGKDYELRGTVMLVR